MSEDNPPSSQGSPKKSWLDRISQLFGGEPQNRKDLVDVIQDAEERDLIDEDTKDMIKGVLEVSDLRVRDVMIPRSQIIAIEKNQPVDGFLSTIIESGHSRFPVVDKDKDHIEGILLAKDLLTFGFTDQNEPVQLEQVIRAAVVVPESKRVDVLLKEFRQKRYHMAIVVDEYGGVSGLVTIEDILEEIVGDIGDEFDIDEANPLNIRKVGKQVWSVAALTPVEEFNDHFGCEFSDDEFDTIGGIVSHAFNHLPVRGEKVILDGFEFKVVNADTRRLLQLQVRTVDNQVVQGESAA
ncbi:MULTISPECIES: CNNM family magnesium/cobalt transport protein CorC [Ferrimonas]|uniref:CNNM family magnesium/cobalt transport protein CorC n=1 Tax=Ferrimonas TaxID=44011 RepID=UPI000414EDE1|nr:MULTISPECIES: CNNM family magnesium/cobalt transport protein CorC [Ferrimonas]USD38246.1 CNNM family magnesium/cobalt transport protein CorC [Ferrimonas sp. SCSIO 43195]